MADLEAFELDGRRYTWDGRRWREDGGGEPPKETARRLAALLRRSRRTAERGLSDPAALVGIAVAARIAGNASRAEQLARRVLAIEPDNATAAAILSSVWREKGKPRAALTLADRFRTSEDPYILTSRSAALCDLGRWEEALAQIREVLAIEDQMRGGGSEESLAVFGRIQGNAPHLFGQPE
jgi:predicted Zn-dependent protease